MTSVLSMKAFFFCPELDSKRKKRGEKKVRLGFICTIPLPKTKQTKLVYAGGKGEGNRYQEEKERRGIMKGTLPNSPTVLPSI